MRKILGALAAVVLFACGSPTGPATEPGAQPAEGLTLTVEQGATQGTFVTEAGQGSTEVKFSSREVEPSVYRLEVRFDGLTLTALLDAENGVSTLDGFAEANGLARFQSAQVYYSIAGRDIEREIVPLARSERVAILPWSPLAGGLLSGKFDPDKAGPEGARRSQFDFPPVDRDRLPRVLAALHSVASATGVSVARVALAWQLTRPFVTSVLIGARTRAQLVDNLAATTVELSAEHVELLDEASALPAEYPGWMVDWQNREPRVPRS